MTFIELAGQMSRAFESAKRANGDSYRRLRDGSPQWMTDVCMAAHAFGDMLPNDWRYRFIEAACDFFADESNDPDEPHEAIDSAVSVVNVDLTAWLNSHPGYRMYYVDTACEELGKPDSLMQMLQYGQYREIEEVFGQVRDALEGIAKQMDD